MTICSARRRGATERKVEKTGGEGVVVAAKKTRTQKRGADGEDRWRGT